MPRLIVKFLRKSYIETMIKKILITGGLGYIGRICQFILSKHGYETFVIDERRQESDQEHNSFMHLNLLHKSNLEQYFQHNKPDLVLHFAAKIEVAESVKKPLYYYQNNVSGTINLLDAMQKWAPVPLVFLSSAAVYAAQSVPLQENSILNPQNPYGESKKMAEAIISHCVNIPSVILRLFNVGGALPEENLGETHQPETHLIPLVIQKIAQKEPVDIFGSQYPSKDGTCLRDYIHVLDVAEAVLCSIRKLENLSTPQSFTYNIGSGNPTSVLEVIEEVSRQLQEQPMIKWKNNRPGDSAILMANIQKATQELLWTPTHSQLSNIITSSIQFQRTKILKACL
jgi:UDP-glucose 4-epimerase